MAKYKVKKSVNNQYYWVLTAGNGEPVLKSETYTSKQGCLHGIGSSQVCVADRNFKRYRSGNNQYYFNQVADNSQVLGISEMYNSSEACENGIAVVKREAPGAQIEDLT